MHLTIVTIGSRGDVQPYVALGSGFLAAGHAVTVATHVEFEGFVRAFGLDFAPIRGNPREMMETEQGRAWLESSKNPIKFMTGMRHLAEPVLNDMMTDTLNACRGADVILPATLGLYSVPHVSEHLGIPFIPAILQPAYDSSYVGHSTFPVAPDWLPLRGVYNRLTYVAARQIMWWLFGDMINQSRADMALQPTNPKAWIQLGAQPSLLGFSEHVIPRPPDWPDNAAITGYWFLDEPDYNPPADLTAFLEAGPPPVYVGFGSMNNRDPEATAELVLDALQQSGQRGLLLTGWNGLHMRDLPDNVFVVDAVPHSWLFPQMAAVVHHAGTGTTAAGLRAGVPSITIPFFADQPFWANRVFRLGVGPAPILRKRLTAKALADAIQTAIADQAMRDRAAILGERIRAEDGVARAVETVETLMAHRMIRSLDSVPV